MDALGSIGMVMGAVSTPLAAVSVPTSAIATSTAAASIAQGTATQQNSKNESSGATSTGPDLKDDPRLEKFALMAHCNAKSSVRNQVHGKQVFLHKKKARALPICFCYFLIANHPKALPRRSRPRTATLSRWAPILWLLSRVPIWTKTRAARTREHN
jgi:hypothetical protein